MSARVENDIGPLLRRTQRLAVNPQLPYAIENNSNGGLKELKAGSSAERGKSPAHA
jgi:hypothetical protein